MDIGGGPKRGEHFGARAARGALTNPRSHRRTLSDEVRPGSALALNRSRRGRDSGQIDVRTILEITVVAVIVYLAIHLGPALWLQIKFQNELKVAAHAPVEVPAHVIRQNVLSAAQRYGIELDAKQVQVRRDAALQRTIIALNYATEIDFWPGLVYLWNVEENVEALLF